MGQEIYLRKGTHEVFRLRSISIDGRAMASLQGISVKYVDKVPHHRLATDYVLLRTGEPGSEWVNIHTGILVEFVKFNSWGIHVVGPKRGKIVPRILKFEDWITNYVPLEKWKP